MESTCSYCKILDVASLIVSDKNTESLINEKLTRYYCQNPEHDNDYCPNKGIKECCSFQEDNCSRSS